MESKENARQTCPGCGGSGQVSFFQGASRFLLTVDECPECHGTGLIAAPPDGEKEKKADRPHENGKGDNHE